MCVYGPIEIQSFGIVKHVCLFDGNDDTFGELKNTIVMNIIQNATIIHLWCLAGSIPSTLLHGCHDLRFLLINMDQFLHSSSDMFVSSQVLQLIR